MKTIGLLGGMSWASTIEYYRILNQLTQARLGGFHSAKILLYSVDFAQIEEFMRTGRWDDAAQLLSESAHRLQTAGADMVLLCTNTLHKVAGSVARAVSIPFLHIGDCTGEAIAAQGLSSVALLGTRFTME